MSLKIILNGALGKMGKSIVEVCSQDKKVEIVGLIENEKCPYINKIYYPSLPKITDNIETCINLCDVVIDFSTPQGTQKVTEICLNNKKPVVIGTTGHNEEQLNKIKNASTFIPILISPNMSFGVNLLYKLLDFTLNKIKNYNFDIEIMEAHHNQKKDAPSGTAKKLLEIIKNIKPESNFIYSREGIVGPRQKNEVGVFAIRAGDIVGEHTILLSSTGEKIEIKHTATSRNTFARGAIEAAKWLKNKKPGLYSIEEMFGL